MVEVSPMELNKTILKVKNQPTLVDLCEIVMPLAGNPHIRYKMATDCL